MSASRRAAVLTAALGGAVTLLLFGNVLFGDDTLCRDDALWLNYPVRVFANRMLLAGRLPLWDPYCFSGRPFIHDIETALFYPFNCLSLIMPMGRYCGWSPALHAWLAFLGAWLYCRRLGCSPLSAWVGAVFYGWGAVITTNAPYPLILPIVAWFPWLLLAFDIGSVPAAAAVVALQITAGALQFLVMELVAAALVTGLYHVPRDGPRAALGRFAAGVGGGVLIAAVQVLPFVEYIPYSSRNFVPSADLASVFALDWKAAAPLLLPEVARASLGNATFLPILCLLLAVVGMVSSSARSLRAALVAVVIVSLLAATGPQTFVYRILCLLVPGYSRFRASVRWLHVTLLAVAVLAALGSEAIMQRAGAAAARVGGALAVLALLEVGWLGFPLRPTVPIASLRVPPVYDVLRRSLPPQARAFILPFVDIETYDWCTVAERPTGTGYFSVAPEAYLQFVAYAARGRLMNDAERRALALGANMLPFWDFNPRFLRLLHVQALVHQPKHDVVVRPVKEIGPRYWLAPNFEVIDSMEATYRRIADPSLPLDTTVLLRKPPALAAGGVPAPRNEVRCDRFEAGRIELTAACTRAEMLVLSETYYPGWIARVDGAPVDVVPAFWILRAVPLAAGTHHVELEFAPRSVYVGGALSLLGILLSLLWGFRSWRRRAASV